MHFAKYVVTYYFVTPKNIQENIALTNLYMQVKMHQLMQKKA